MPGIEQQIADHLSELSAAGIALQGMRFREDWEPRVVRTLGGMAELCLLRLNGMLPELLALPDHKRTVAGLHMRLGRALAPVVSRQSQAAKEILRQMVRQEAAATGEALTLGGLAGDAPGLTGTGRAYEQLVDHLACCRALDLVVGKSFVDATGRFAAELAGGAEDAGMMLSLAEAAKAWRSSLERIARTTTHQSANLVREAVGAAMS